MHFFDSSGVRIAFIDLAPTGADLGEPILLIHGFASNHAVNWVNTMWTRTLAHAGRPAWASVRVHMVLTQFTA